MTPDLRTRAEQYLADCTWALETGTVCVGCQLVRDLLAALPQLPSQSEQNWAAQRGDIDYGPESDHWEARGYPPLVAVGEISAADVRPPKSTLDVDADHKEVRARGMDLPVNDVAVAVPQPESVALTQQLAAAEQREQALRDLRERESKLYNEMSERLEALAEAVRHAFKAGCEAGRARAVWEGSPSLAHALPEPPATIDAAFRTYQQSRQG